MEGTYPLPEAQRDRFMARAHMGYPDRGSEIAMLQSHGADDPLEDVAPVTDAAEVRDMIEAVRRVYVAPTIDAYVVDLVGATRQHSLVRLGASPRAALHLLRAARASAALAGRAHVLPDDVQRLAGPVLAHRLVLTTDAHLARTSPQDVVAEIIARVPLPASA
jgi:MoxR-like ATPase